MDPDQVSTDSEPVAEPAVEETPAEPAEETVPKSEYDELHGRAKRAEEKLKELTREPEPKTPEPINSPQPKGLSIDDKVDLRLAGHSKEDIALIERNMAGRSVEETLGDPYVKAALDGVRSTRTAEESTQEPSSTVPTFTAENKTWAQMTKDERKANYNTAIGNIQNRGGRQVE